MVLVSTAWHRYTRAVCARMGTVHEKMDWTQYPILRPQFRPIQNRIQFTRALMRSYLQTLFSYEFLLNV